MSHFYAVELFFDDSTSDKVRALWRSLAESGLSDKMHTMPGIHPHITLTAFSAGDLSDDEVMARFRQFNLPEQSFPLNIEGISAFFPLTGVVYLAPTPSEHLLAAHRHFFDTFYKHEDLTAFEHYLPKRWIPHCTLAIQLPLENIHEVIAHCLPQMKEALQPQITSVGLVKITKADNGTITTAVIEQKQLT